MNLAKISSNGQITVPKEIRHELKIKTGDKIIFMRNNRGEITMQSLTESAITEVQRAVSGNAFYKEALAGMPT
jgi:AbrB family looped-hinge helix DNA binding protein